MTTSTSARRAAQTQELWELWKRTGDVAHRNRIVTMYTPLVRYIAVKKVRDLPIHFDLDDLVSAGLVALIEAIERWEPERGTQLEQFAWTRVQGSMLDELRKVDWAPRRLRRSERALNTAQTRLMIKNGREGTEDEIAEELGLDRDQLAALRADLARATVGSLNTGVASSDDGAIECIDVIASTDEDGGDPVTSVLRHEQRDILISSLSRLTQREREVAVLIYSKGYSQREAGDILGITESRVSQLHTSLRRTLRVALEEGDLALAA